MTGSLAAMDELLTIIHELSDLQLMQVCPIVLQHISIGNIPTTPQANNEIPDKPVQLALRAFEILAEARVKDHSVPRATLVRFHQQNWLEFLPWIEFFVEKLELQQNIKIIQSGGRKDIMMREFLVRTLNALAFFLGITAKVALRPGSRTPHRLSPMILRIWLIAMATNQEEALRGSSDHLRSLLMIFQAAETPAREQFARCVEDPRYNAVPVIVRALRQESRRSLIPSISLKCTLAIALYSAKYSNKFLRSSLVAGSISVIVSVLSRSTSHHNQLLPTDTEDFADVQFSLCMCADFMLECFDEGPTYIAEALEKHILISILKSSSFLQANHVIGAMPTDSSGVRLEDHYAGLFEYLINHLLYPSVLREIIRSLKTAEVRGLKFDSQQNKTISAQWEVLKTEALRRKAWRSDVYMVSPRNVLCSSEQVRCHTVFCHLFVLTRLPFRLAVSTLWSVSGPSPKHGHKLLLAMSGGDLLLTRVSEN